MDIKVKQLFINQVLLLYRCLGCEVGGPLHIVLDDNNIDDTSILWCLKECFKDDTWNDNIKALTCEIGGLLLLIPINKRNSVVNEAWEYVNNKWRTENVKYW